ncbi:MAG: MBL fold metallo-hydrolase [Alphaproteobacteria bacterium]|nr:MBL fold metallo-hydrolase [Alphaproteobacteria bacterium]
MTPIRVGAATVARIEESYEPNFDPRLVFAEWSDDVRDAHRDWMVPNHFDVATGLLKLSVHSWLVRVGGRNVLIDACVGNHKPRPRFPKWHLMETPYLDRLAAAGVRPEAIDVVMCTHLHSDHVGWNTRLDDGRWVPTFPNARYVFSRADYDYHRALDADPAKGPQAAFRDSVLPVVEAGRAEMVDGAHALDEHLVVDPHPGHTPGTVAIRLASRGEAALFSGDILHHAIQVHHPDWNSSFCADPAAARRSRRRVLEHCAGSGALLMPAHFGAPFVCRIESRGDRFIPHLD